MGVYETLFGSDKEDLEATEQEQSFLEILGDNIIGFDNKRESAGEAIAKKFNEDELGFLKDMGIGMYEGAKEFVKAPIETTKEVVSDIYTGTKDLLTKDLDERLMDMYGVTREEATAEQINNAREGVFGDALTASTIIPSVGVITKGTKLLAHSIPDLDTTVQYFKDIDFEFDPNTLGSNFGNFRLRKGNINKNLRNYSMEDVNRLNEAIGDYSGIKSGRGPEGDAKLGLLPENGTIVALRPNLNSAIPNNPLNIPDNPKTGKKGETKLTTVHDGTNPKKAEGDVYSYLPYAVAENVTFVVNQNARRQIASRIHGLDVADAKNKYPSMSVVGSFNGNRNLLDEGTELVEIGVNPAVNHLFVDLSTGHAVKGADAAMTIGDRVYAVGVKYFNADEAPKAQLASDGTELPNTVTYKYANAAEEAADTQSEQLFGIGHNQGPPLTTTMKNVLDARANEMSKPVSERTGPAGAPLFDTSPEAYERNTVPQEKIYVPRNPNPKAKLPLNNRAQILIDMQEEIAQELANRMRPFLGKMPQYFYNTEPIREKALAMGYSKEYVDEWMKEFSEAYAATSPRTETAQNLRNASLVMAKRKQGIPLDEIVGEGTGGLNEKGYPMMIGESGIHGKLAKATEEGGIDPDANTKPFTFAKNVEGNLQGATVDTHAIRGVLDALNTIKAGSVPKEWIKPKWREAYKEDPSQLDPATWFEDTLATQAINKKNYQTEYAIVSDIYTRAGEILGVSPAEAQSMGWFGSGDRTGLLSEPKTIVDLLDERIGVTANVMNFSKNEIFRFLMDRDIPLLSVVGGSALAATAMAPQEESGLMSPEEM